MDIRLAIALYKRHRFPAEVISHAVWLYFRFCPSYRDVEALMAERGISLTDEAARSWCRKFAQAYAHTWPRPTLLGQSRWPISNARGVRVTREMDSVSLAFECCLSPRFFDVFELTNRVRRGHVCGLHGEMRFAS
jgi:hypothetical protein